MSRATVSLYHLDNARNTTVTVSRLSVLSTPNLLPKMKMVGQLLLESKRRMDSRIVGIKKKRTKESMAEMIVQWDPSVVPRTTYKIEKRKNLKTTFFI